MFYASTCQAQCLRWQKWNYNVLCFPIKEEYRAAPPSSPIRRSCYGCWCGLISSHGRTTLSEFALKILLFISIAKDKPAYNVEYFVIFCKRKMIVSLVFLPHHDCQPHGERDIY